MSPTSVTSTSEMPMRLLDFLAPRDQGQDRTETALTEAAACEAMRRRGDTVALHMQWPLTKAPELKDAEAWATAPLPECAS